MVEVATGGNSGGSSGNSISGGGGGGGGSSSSADEQLPMVVRVCILFYIILFPWLTFGYVIQVPHLGSDPLLVCNLQSYSLLGFGDILVPGMLVGFCHGFDLATNNRRKLYFIITLIGNNQFQETCSHIESTNEPCLNLNIRVNDNGTAVNSWCWSLRWRVGSIYTSPPFPSLLDLRVSSRSDMEQSCL